tara:strand:- start:51 stop:320 length:270 start_codon:yes stop_codon:yes gene_type:complete
MTITKQQIIAFALTLNLVDIYEFDTITFDQISSRAFSERMYSDAHAKWVNVLDAYNWFLNDNGENDKFGFRQSSLEKNTKILIDAKIIE